MANKHTTLNDLFTGIADAIRSKKDSTENIIADNFPTEIENIKTGFDYNNQKTTTISDYAFYCCEDLVNVECYNLTKDETEIAMARKLEFLILPHLRRNINFLKKVIT